MANILLDDARPCFSSVDNNNNSQKYSLRPRASRRRSDSPAPPEEKPTKPKRSRREKHHPPLSKYRRKTANARERSRMREINEAFETLRRAVPQVAAGDTQSEKMTKISTLKLAMEYISALHRALGDSRESEILSDISVSRRMTSPPPYPKPPFPSTLCDFNDLSLTPETTDQSLSSTSDVSDLFLISLDLDGLPQSDVGCTASIPVPDRTFGGFDQCSFDDVLFANGLS